MRVISSSKYSNTQSKYTQKHKLVSGRYEVERISDITNKARVPAKHALERKEGKIEKIICIGKTITYLSFETTQAQASRSRD